MQCLHFVVSEKMEEKQGRRNFLLVMVLSVCGLFYSGCGDDALEPATLEVGYFDLDGLFTPLDETGELVIIYGFQGGTWSMPGIMCTHFADDRVLASATVTTDTGELIGDMAEIYIQIVEDGSGYQVADNIQIPMVNPGGTAGDFIDEMYDGRAATLVVNVRDTTGQNASFTQDLTVIIELPE